MRDRAVLNELATGGAPDGSVALLAATNQMVVTRPGQPNGFLRAAAAAPLRFRMRRRAERLEHVADLRPTELEQAGAARLRHAEQSPRVNLARCALAACGERPADTASAPQYARLCPGLLTPGNDVERTLAAVRSLA
jgi:hypothetical protein